MQIECAISKIFLGLPLEEKILIHMTMELLPGS